MSYRIISPSMLGTWPLAAGLAGLVFALGSPMAHGQANQPGDKPQERDPFAPAAVKARELPSILSRDAQGQVVDLETDPSRKALELMDLAPEVRRDMDHIMAERDAQLLQAAVPNTDKIVRAYLAWRAGEGVAFDALGRYVMNSLGVFGRRGAFHIDSQVRKTAPRTVYVDLNAIVREYNSARLDEVRDDLIAAAAGTDTPEAMLRDSTMLQRIQQRDVVFDAARMLKERYGGEAELSKAHPELADTIKNEGYWKAVSKLTNAQLATFVREQTGMEVQFPSPEAHSGN